MKITEQKQTRLHLSGYRHDTRLGLASLILKGTEKEVTERQAAILARLNNLANARKYRGGSDLVECNAAIGSSFAWRWQGKVKKGGTDAIGDLANIYSRPLIEDRRSFALRDYKSLALNFTDRKGAVLFSFDMQQKQGEGGNVGAVAFSYAGSSVSFESKGAASPEATSSHRETIRMEREGCT